MSPFICCKSLQFPGKFELNIECVPECIAKRFARVLQKVNRATLLMLSWVSQRYKRPKCKPRVFQSGSKGLHQLHVFQCWEDDEVQGGQSVTPRPVFSDEQRSPLSGDRNQRRPCFQLSADTSAQHRVDEKVRGRLSESLSESSLDRWSPAGCSWRVSKAKKWIRNTEALVLFWLWM